MLLPRAATPPQPAPSQPAGTIEARSSRATILLVDDDDAVRATTADVLYGLGYKVLQASGGREAIDVLHADNMIDVLLTDVVMPGMSGTALARHVRATWPKLPVVFISGYAEPEDIAGEHLGRLVRKPFNVLDLRKQIEDAIDEAHASLV